MLKPLLSKVTVLALLTFSTLAMAQDIPKGFSVPATTHSPDHRYGVTVPMIEQEEQLKDAQNSLVDLQTGRVVAVIHANPGWNRMNHGGVLPSRWSADGSLLLWEVDGKWSPDALVLLKMEKGEVVWQTDILKAAQEAILMRTKKAAPQKYAAAKKANAGNGAAYPEGFTIDVEAIDPVALPLNIRVALTSNPKGIENFPDVESNLEGFIDAQGRFFVKTFHLSPGQSRHF